VSEPSRAQPSLEADGPRLNAGASGSGHLEERDVPAGVCREQTVLRGIPGKHRHLVLHERIANRLRTATRLPEQDGAILRASGQYRFQRVEGETGDAP
jgi:hypothetical protein